MIDGYGGGYPLATKNIGHCLTSLCGAWEFMVTHGSGARWQKRRARSASAQGPRLTSRPQGMQGRTRGSKKTRVH